MASHPVPALRVALLEKLTWPPAPSFFCFCFFWSSFYLCPSFLGMGKLAARGFLIELGKGWRARSGYLRPGDRHASRTERRQTAGNTTQTKNRTRARSQKKKGQKKPSLPLPPSLAPASLLLLRLLTVPVARDGLGVERHLDVVRLGQPVQQVARHPHVVAALDPDGWADLVLPLGGHDLGVDAADLDARVQAHLVVDVCFWFGLVWFGFCAFFVVCFVGGFRRDACVFGGGGGGGGRVRVCGCGCCGEDR